MGLAIRQYFRSPMEHSGWFEAYLDIRSKDESLPGYGWVFPVGDGTVNAGVGLLSTFGGWRDVNLHNLQKDFIGSLPPEWDVNYDTVCSKPRGGRLFMGQSVWPPHGPGFLLTGDARRDDQPLQRRRDRLRIRDRPHRRPPHRRGAPERLVAELDGYTEELEETYGPYYRLGRRFVKLIGHPVLMEKLVSVGMHSRPS